MKGTNDAKDTFLMEGESNALTFLLISHTHLSSLKSFIHGGCEGMGESMRDEIYKNNFAMMSATHASYYFSFIIRTSSGTEKPIGINSPVSSIPSPRFSFSIHLIVSGANSKISPPCIPLPLICFFR